MGFPSLNEMLNAIQASQQNAFIPAYQDSIRQKQERDYKEQQMNKLIQDMQLAADMHPHEIKSKVAATRYNNALSKNQENVAAKTEIEMNDPLYQPSVSAGLQQVISKADEAKHDSTIKSSQANVIADQHMAQRAFFENPTIQKAIATSPELTVQYQKILSDLKAASMRSNTAKDSNMNQYEALEKYETAMANAENEFKKYATWNGSQWVLNRKEDRQKAEQALAAYKLAERMKNNLTVSNTQSSNPFGLPPQNKTTVKGSTPQGTQTQGNAPAGYVRGADGVLRKQQ